jgi:hypothetical protein
MNKFYEWYSNDYDRYIINILKKYFNKDSLVIDIGGSNGSFSKKFYLDNPIDIVDVYKSPYHFSGTRYIGNNIEVIPNNSYDIALIKEAIHYFNNEIFYNNLYRITDEAIILMRPERIEIPLFHEALLLWKTFDRPPSVINNLKKAGFKVNISFFKVPSIVSKKKYFNMILNRHFTMYYNFTDEQLLQGLEELDASYTDPIMFNDHFILIRAIK